MFKSKIVGVVVQVQDGKKRVLGESVIPVDEDTLFGDKPFRKDIANLGEVPDTKRGYRRTDIRKQDLVTMRKNGMSNKSIAEHFGCSTSTIYSIDNGKHGPTNGNGKHKAKKTAKKQDKPVTVKPRINSGRRPRQLDLRDVSKMVSLYKQGMSVAKLAKQFKSVVSTIYRRFGQVAETDEVLKKKLLNRGK